MIIIEKKTTKNEIIGYFMLTVTTIGIITLSFFYIYSLVHVLNINFFILIEKEKKAKDRKRNEMNSHRYMYNQ